MSDHEFLDDRRRASEDDYLRKAGSRLSRKCAKASAEAERNRNDLSATTGLNDPGARQRVARTLGFTPDTGGAAARADRPDGLG